VGERAILVPGREYRYSTLITAFLLAFSSFLKMRWTLYPQPVQTNRTLWTFVFPYTRLARIASSAVSQAAGSESDSTSGLGPFEPWGSPSSRWRSARKMFRLQIPNSVGISSELVASAILNGRARNDRW